MVRMTVGNIPHIPWWKLMFMSGADIHEFNMKHLVEISMDDGRENIEKIKAKQQFEKDTWNAAIEAAAKHIQQNVYHEAQDTNWDLGYNHAKQQSVDEIRKLKK